MFTEQSTMPIVYLSSVKEMFTQQSTMPIVYLSSVKGLPQLWQELLINYQVIRLKPGALLSKSKYWIIKNNIYNNQC